MSAVKDILGDAPGAIWSVGCGQSALQAIRLMAEKCIGDLVKAVIKERQFTIDQLEHYIAGRRLNAVMPEACPIPSFRKAGKQGAQRICFPPIRNLLPTGAIAFPTVTPAVPGYARSLLSGRASSIPAPPRFMREIPDR